MARKSRKGNNISQAEKTKHQYAAGAYIRVSVEKDSSIETQKSIINGFVAEHPDIDLVKVYVDNGVSSFFNVRPEFDMMIDDAKAHTIDCIITRDLSRLGRNYIEIGDFVEQIFPAWGVRFISISEMYDSNKSNPNLLLMASRNLVNSSYSYDISAKVKATVQVRQQHGNYIGAALPYGYVKQAICNKTSWSIDESSALVVRQIFEWAATNESAYAIATRLNDSDIPSPKAYKGKGTSFWSRRSVMDILRNRAYIGCLIAGKTRTPDWQLRNPMRAPSLEYIVTENHHDAIIDRDLFERIQHLLNARKTPASLMRFRTSDDSYLESVLFCGNCGRKMKRRIWKGKTYYICPRTMEAKNGCSTRSISEDSLKYDVFDTIQVAVEKAARYYEEQLATEKDLAFKVARRYTESLLHSLESQRQLISQLTMELFEQFSDGLYTQSDYSLIRRVLQNQTETLKLEVHYHKDRLRHYDENIASYSPSVKSLLKYETVGSLSNEMVRELVAAVKCYAGYVDITLKAKINE